MTDDQNKPGEESEASGGDPLRIEDIVRYLSHLVKLLSEPRTGNSELSHGLQQLANALRPHCKRPISDITAVTRGAFLSKEASNAPKKIKAALPQNLETLSEQTIDQILGDHSYTKLQLIDLGTNRFGISRSKLMRLSRNQVVESVRAALDHERSIGVISEEARRGGEKRSS